MNQKVSFDLRLNLPKIASFLQSFVCVRDVVESGSSFQNASSLLNIYTIHKSLQCVGNIMICRLVVVGVPNLEFILGFVDVDNQLVPLLL